MLIKFTFDVHSFKKQFLFLILLIKCNTSISYNNVYAKKNMHHSHTQSPAVKPLCYGMANGLVTSLFIKVAINKQFEVLMFSCCTKTIQRKVGYLIKPIPGTHTRPSAKTRRSGYAQLVYWRQRKSSGSFRCSMRTLELRTLC